MPLTKDEAQGVTRLFIRDYPGALDLAYNFRQNVAELYGPRAAEVPASMKGGYLPRATTHAGRLYRGRVDVPLENVIDARDLLLTLRHEVLGHYGANTFAPGEKRAFLDGLIAAREEPSLKTSWADIDHRYAGSSLNKRAEEVYALHCEGIVPSHHASADQVRRGQQAFQETCRAPVRLMRQDDLQSIAHMVAQGLRDRTRTQQNFPAATELFRKKETEMNPKKPFHETVAEKLIEKLKQGTAPWQLPWKAGEPGAALPINPTTGKRYKGINALHLMSQGHSDQRWMTYKQAAASDAQVRKGEKGTSIQYWKFNDEQTKLDANGQPVLDAKSEPVKQTIKLERPRVFFATVFNAEQIDGLPALPPRTQPNWDPVERAEIILQASAAVIKHGEQNRAFYRPATDSIHLPDKAQFPSADNYYAIALHELGHWTGHGSRLDRDLANPFGSEGYAKEELRAEIASMILGDELGIGHDPGQHVAYVASWIKVLEEDPLEIFRAASDAEKIQNFVLAFEQQQVQEQSTQQGQAEQESQILVELQELHQTAYEGYSPLESWNNLKATAHASGLTASIGRGGAGEYDPPYVVAYADQAGEKTPITTEFFSDGKAVTQVSGQRVSGTGLTSDHGWQSAALFNAVLQVRSQTPTQEADMIVQSTSAASLGVKSFIKVPFAEKSEAKELGAKWDAQQRSWYVPTGFDTASFAKWADGPGPARAEAPTQTQTQTQTNQRVYLSVPYDDRAAAKTAGAVWDKPAKAWYAGPKADMQILERWAADKVPAQQGPAMTPEEEFSQALHSMGCLVDGKHPTMDGGKHRIAVLGDKKGEQAGFYVGHLDGHPAGYIKNNKTGEVLKWKSKGYALDPEQKAQMHAQAATKLQERAAEHARVQEQASLRVIRQTADLVPVTRPTAYMLAKGLQPQAGVMTDALGEKTYIPATDANGKQWTMQYIQEDGTKRFAKDSRKEGCFHVVGGLEALARAPALVISEGYATAGSLSQTLGFATVAAFDSGNLVQVAKDLNKRFPDKPIIIAGDDDKHLEVTQGANPGRSKAEEAAKAVGGLVLLPIFAPGEATYPQRLPPVTPESYREHLSVTKALDDAQQEPEQGRLTEQKTAELKNAQLSAAQLSALSAMKRHTDFNDLATKSELSQDAMHRQVNSIVDAVIEKHRAKIEQQEKRQVQESVREQPQERPRRVAKIR